MLFYSGTKLSPGNWVLRRNAVLLVSVLYFAAVVGEFPGAINCTGANTSRRTLIPMYFERARALTKAFSVCAICKLAVFYVWVVDTIPFFNVIVRPLNDVGFTEIGTCSLYLKLLLAFYSSLSSSLVPIPRESSTCSITIPSNSSLVCLINTQGISFVRVMFKTLR